MCVECDWLYFLDLADDMLLDEKYEFASDTVEGIKNWIKENEHITEKQKKAIENIYCSKEDN